MKRKGASWADEAGVGRYELDRAGQLVVTPELEAALHEAEAEADRGEGIPLDDVLRDLARRRTR